VEYTEVAPCIFVYDNAFDKCEELIHRSLRNRGAWQRATVGNQELNPEMRNCDLMPIDTSIKGHLNDIILAKCLFDHADHYGKETHSAISDMEPLQLLHYKKSDQYYRPHVDDGAEQPRIFSAVLYLNDVEEGGETRFTKFNIAVKPKQGRLLMFPSNYAYEHEALPPQSEEKFAVVTWFTPVMKWLVNEF
jgi:hypothetical protein